MDRGDGMIAAVLTGLVLNRGSGRWKPRNDRKMQASFALFHIAVHNSARIVYSNHNLLKKDSYRTVVPA